MDFSPWQSTNDVILVYFTVYRNGLKSVLPVRQAIMFFSLSNIFNFQLT